MSIIGGINANKRKIAKMAAAGQWLGISEAKYQAAGGVMAKSSKAQYQRLNINGVAAALKISSSSNGISVAQPASA